MRQRSGLDRTLHRATGTAAQAQFRSFEKEQLFMNNIVYIVGAVVIVMVILSVLGFR